MRKTARQKQIEEIRAQQQGRFGANLSDRMFDERFDRHFDRMESKMDDFNPIKMVLGFGLIALIGNFLFWGMLILLTLFGLNHFGVI